MLRNIRKQYEYAALTEQEAHPNPFDQFESWLITALKSDEQEPTAMALSTVDENLQPHARMVLLKDFTAEGLSFFTNYAGNKARHIEQNPKVSLLFFWQSLERQIRITGTVTKLTRSESDAYFQSRPRESRIGAWASEQSKTIPSAEFLAQRFDELSKKFGDEIPTPEHWGGYRVLPRSFEFWQGRPSRLHDRLLYQLQEDGSWTMERLAP